MPCFKPPYRTLLGVGPHELFPPDSLRRFRPGDHVCVAPDSKEHPWREGTILDVTTAAFNNHMYKIALEADKTNSSEVNTTEEVEIECTASCLKYGVLI